MHGLRRRAGLYGILGASAATVVIGIPTALLPNPIFGRMIAPTVVDYVVFAVTVLLTGALAATAAWPSACPLPQRRFGAGTVVSFLAVGCPTCNKLVVLLLGTSGAVQWFAPLQPVLGLIGIGLLTSALVVRLRAVRSGERGQSIATRQLST